MLFRSFCFLFFIFIIFHIFSLNYSARSRSLAPFSSFHDDVRAIVIILSVDLYSVFSLPRQEVDDVVPVVAHDGCVARGDDIPSHR